MKFIVQTFYKADPNSEQPSFENPCENLKEAETLFKKLTLIPESNLERVSLVVIDDNDAKEIHTWEK